MLDNVMIKRTEINLDVHSQQADLITYGMED